MAWSAPADISTNAKPRDRPVSRSVTTWADSTAPNSPNASRRSSAVVPKGRLPTYNFLLMVILPRGLLGPGKNLKTHSRPRRQERGQTRVASPAAVSAPDRHRDTRQACRKEPSLSNSGLPTEEGGCEDGNSERLTKGGQRAKAT